MNPLTLFLDVLGVCVGLALGGLCLAAAAFSIVCVYGAVRRREE